MPEAVQKRMGMPKVPKATDFSGPQKNRTAYFVFGDKQRSKVMETMKKKEGKVDITKVGAELATKWKALAEKEKKPFEETAAKEKLKYNDALTAWKQTEKFTEYQLAVSAAKKKKADKAANLAAKETGKPKLPTSAWALFVKENSVKVIEQLKKEGNASPDMKARSILLQKLFKALPKKESDKLVEQAVKLKAAYEKDLEAWKQTDGFKAFKEGQAKSLMAKKKADNAAKGIEEKPKAKKSATKAPKKSSQAKKSVMKSLMKSVMKSTMKSAMKSGRKSSASAKK